MFEIVVPNGRTLGQVSSRAGSHRNDSWVRADAVPATGIDVRVVSRGHQSSDTTPAWFVRGRNTTVSFRDNDATGSVIFIQPDRTLGDRIEVRCRIGSQELHHTIWSISGEIRVRDRGPLTAQSRNSARRRVVRELVGNGAIPRLGMFTAHDSAGNTQYGALVELVGTVRPWDVPVPFHMVRRVAGLQVEGGFEFPELHADDTTRNTFQDQTLSPQGRIFDLDAPGSHFTPDDPVGFKHKWNVRFEQMIAIGELRPGRTWYDATSGGLAISPIRRWGVDFQMEVTRSGRHPTLQSEIRSIGEIV